MSGHQWKCKDCHSATQLCLEYSQCKRTDSRLTTEADELDAARTSAQWCGAAQLVLLVWCIWCAVWAALLGTVWCDDSAEASADGCRSPDTVALVVSLGGLGVGGALEFVLFCCWSPRRGGGAAGDVDEWVNGRFACCKAWMWFVTVCCAMVPVVIGLQVLLYDQRNGALDVVVAGTGGAVGGAGTVEDVRLSDVPRSPASDVFHFPAGSMTLWTGRESWHGVTQGKGGVRYYELSPLLSTSLLASSANATARIEERAVGPIPPLPDDRFAAAPLVWINNYRRWYVRPDDDSGVPRLPVVPIGDAFTAYRMTGPELDTCRGLIVRDAEAAGWRALVARQSEILIVNMERALPNPQTILLAGVLSVLVVWLPAVWLLWVMCHWRIDAQRFGDLRAYQLTRQQIALAVLPADAGAEAGGAGGAADKTWSGGAGKPDPSAAAGNAAANADAAAAAAAGALAREASPAAPPPSAASGSISGGVQVAVSVDAVGVTLPNAVPPNPPN